MGFTTRRPEEPYTTSVRTVLWEPGGQPPRLPERQAKICSRESATNLQEVPLELVQLGEIQNSYSIIDREDDPIVELAREREIAFVPFFPLGSAFTGGPAKLAQDPTISKVAEKHGATASQVALAWLLARYERMLLIPGTTSVAHLEENLAAIDLQLDADDLAELDAVEQVGRPLG